MGASDKSVPPRFGNNVALTPPPAPADAIALP